MIRSGVRQQRVLSFAENLQFRDLELCMGVSMPIEAGGDNVYDCLRNREAK